MNENNKKTAVWVLTKNGMDKALVLSDHLPELNIFKSDSLQLKDYDVSSVIFTFKKPGEKLKQEFNNYSSHIFFMATGIVVRLIAPLIKSKLSDPSVVVVDDKGLNAISLLSGHIGGANELTLHISKILGSNPVITTATDVNNLPSIDLFAQEKKLVIENPENIKTVNMAFINGEKVSFFDPYNYLRNETFNYDLISSEPEFLEKPAVYIDYKLKNLKPDIFVLRPQILCVGIGCNRGTDPKEIYDFFIKTLDENSISVKSVNCFATIDIKNDETGILELAEKMDLPLKFFTREQLDNVNGIQTPSLMVEKHIGVKSVCEAAAIKASKTGKLIVPKRKNRNVTMAIAKFSQ